MFYAILLFILILIGGYKMKAKKEELLWRCDPANDKKIEAELKKKGKALLDYAIKHKIGHLSMTVIGDDYVTVCAKPNSRSDEYTVDAHAFMVTKEKDNE